MFFSTAILAINQKLYKCPTLGEQLNKFWYHKTVHYYATINTMIINIMYKMKNNYDLISNDA